MNIRRLHSALTISCSAVLLFVIQPMVAKTLLPRFGGSAGVWVACMMFFQVVLLLGYLYAYCVTRYAGPRVRTVTHLALLAASLVFLPLHPGAGSLAGSPTLSILIVLASSVGLPFLLLSSTSPLIQSWYAKPGGISLSYRLFALSNIVCLLALLAYPLAIEPALGTPLQLGWWSAGYAVFVLLMGAGTVYHRAWSFDEADSSEQSAASDFARPLLWVALAACASALWLAVANYVSQEVAPIPLLWVVPLTLYLLTFVLCFGWSGWYRPQLFRLLLPVAWIGIGSRIGLAGTGGDLRVDLVIILASLFIMCLFCHGELARTKPVARQELPYFYLMVAAGGAAGGIFVGLLAPAIFSSWLELPIGIVGTVFLALVLVYGITSRGRLIRLAVLSAAAFIIASSYRSGSTAVDSRRNFYGTMQIRDSGDGETAVRSLYNGRTVHGVQFLSAARRGIPTAYYGRQSGAGLLLDSVAAPNRRVGFIGLGAGTLAAYGRHGDSFRFFEINPAVIDAAASQFRFLADSAARNDVVGGDGRLRLAEEPSHSFDLLVLDAFSDDAIPVHLLTRQAFELYFAHLRSGCCLAIHVTNRYLDLDPVVEALAQSIGKSVLRIHSPADAEQQTIAADWEIVSDGSGPVAALQKYADPRSVRIGPLWTDEYSNLLQVWR